MIPGHGSAKRFVRASGAAFNVVGAHMDPPLVTQDKTMFLARLKARVDECKQEAIFVVGDWSFVGAEEVRLSMGSKSSGVSSMGRAGSWERT